MYICLSQCPLYNTLTIPPAPNVVLQNILHKSKSKRILVGRCDDSVEVDSAAGGADVGDRGRPSGGLSIDGDHDVSGAAVEWHLNELHSCGDGEILANATNPN